MKNKKGFTLIELLAVIIILGIISIVSVSGLMAKRKSANIKLAKSIENSLTEVGNEVYGYEIIKGEKGSNSFNYCLKNKDIFYISLEELKKAGYLKNITSDYKFVSPEGSSKTCFGYLEVTKDDSAPKFKGYIDCGKLYKTAGYSLPTSNYCNLSKE